MTRRLVILTEIISPYRIPLFNALAQCAGVDLHVIFLAETDPVLRNGGSTKTRYGFRMRCCLRGDRAWADTMRCLTAALAAH